MLRKLSKREHLSFTGSTETANTTIKRNDIAISAEGIQCTDQNLNAAFNFIPAPQEITKKFQASKVASGKDFKIFVQNQMAKDLAMVNVSPIYEFFLNYFFFFLNEISFFTWQSKKM